MGDQRPVVRYDQRARGRSGGPNELSLWDIGQFVEGMHELGRQRGLERIHPRGHSWRVPLLISTSASAHATTVSASPPHPTALELLVTTLPGGVIPVEAIVVA